MDKKKMDDELIVLVFEYIKARLKEPTPEFEKALPELLRTMITHLIC